MTHLLEPVQVAIDIHGRPREDEQAWRHLLLQVLQVWLQQGLEHWLHVRHHVLKSTHLCMPHTAKMLRQLSCTEWLADRLGLLGKRLHLGSHNMNTRPTLPVTHGRGRCPIQSAWQLQQSLPCREQHHPWLVQTAESRPTPPICMLVCVLTSSNSCAK